MKEIKTTKMIEEVTGYEAFDGKWFKEKEECEKYERSAYGVITKEFEQLFIDKRFAECQIWENFGYGSEEYELAVIEIKDENDLNIANKYYELVTKGTAAKLIGKEYIGKRVLVSLGYKFDRFVEPCPWTVEELKEQFEKDIMKFFNPQPKESTNKAD